VPLLLLLVHLAWLVPFTVWHFAGYFNGRYDAPNPNPTPTRSTTRTSTRKV